MPVSCSDSPLTTDPPTLRRTRLGSRAAGTGVRATAERCATEPSKLRSTHDTELPNVPGLPHHAHYELLVVPLPVAKLLLTTAPALECGGQRRVGVKQIS